MTDPVPFAPDSSSDSTWTAFVRDDAQMLAPPELEARVFNAIHSVKTVRRVPRVWWGGVAASLILSFAVGFSVGKVLTMFAPLPFVDAARGPLADNTTAEPVVRFVHDPQPSTETAHIVRMRVPRHVLRSLECPDTNLDCEIVDVDVVISADGMPRELRAVVP